ncbi:MAG: lipoprotein signal peptidase [Cupriavidus sp.]|nr:lipoprotein signal peptidase [Cupriavidus sp.]
MASSSTRPARQAPARGKSKAASSNVTPWLWMAFALLVVMIDQFFKVVISRSFQYGESRPVTSFFNLVLVYNKGAAFSFLADAGGWQRWFFTLLGVVAATVIIWLLKRHNGQKMFCLSLSLILGGALGNVIDRLVHGYVVDFIQVHWDGAYFPSFNVADSAITVGAILLIWDELRRVRKSS